MAVQVLGCQGAGAAPPGSPGGDGALTFPVFLADHSWADSAGVQKNQKGESLSLPAALASGRQRGERPLPAWGLRPIYS